MKGSQHCSFLLRILLVIGIANWPATPPRSFGQGRNLTPTVLKGPADWRFERLPIPPGFARDIPWTGFEEARFAPGMFDTASSSYFCYALAITLEGAPAIQA